MRQDTGSSTEIDPALRGENEGQGGQRDGADVHEENKIQILDLHTRNPLVSFQGQIYSCAWATTIGTDVLLTHPSSSIPFAPELKLPGVNVLASTGIKLLGTPVQLVPKRDAHADKFTRRAEAAAIQQVVDDHERQYEATSTQQQQQDDVAMSEVAKGKRPEGVGEEDDRRLPPPILEPLRLPIGPQNGRAKNLQARFLERIANAKARKGDTDKVIINSKKKITGSGWRAWYRQKEAAEREERERVGDEDEDEQEQDAAVAASEDEDARRQADHEGGTGQALEERLRDQDDDEEMHDEVEEGEGEEEEEEEQDSIDSDDPVELLFPTKTPRSSGDKSASLKPDPPV